MWRCGAQANRLSAQNSRGARAVRGAERHGGSRQPSGAPAAGPDAPRDESPESAPPPSEVAAGEGSSGQADRQVGEKQIERGAEEAMTVEEIREGEAAGKSDVSLSAAGQVKEASVVESVTGEGKDEDMEDDSDLVSVDGSQLGSAELYTLHEINDFLDETFGKSVSVAEYFPDGEKFIKSVLTLQRLVGLDLLDEKKRFHLKKHMTSLRKMKAVNRGKASKRLKTKS